MEVKEAVEFDYINFLKSIKEFVTREFRNPPGKRDVIKRLNEIIALLQQGEKLKVENIELKKYKEMWGWLDNMVNANGMEYNRVWKVQVGKLMYDLEQKYFPKEVGNNGR